MTVTQYIGARYVPVFADPAEWNDTRTYEPLTIVMHEGNSYTSKQYVPVGVNITNTAFWAETGNYNAQIEMYRQEVLNVRDDLADTQAEVDAIELNVDNLESSVNTLRAKGEGTYKVDYLGRIYTPDYTYQKPQGFCLISDDVALVSLTDSTTTNACIMIQVNLLTGEILNTFTRDFAHCNDMAYNRKNEKLYVCPANDYSGDTAVGIHYMYQCNPFTLNVENTIQFDFRPHAVCYDIVTEKMYIIGVEFAANEFTLYEFDYTTNQATALYTYTNAQMREKFNLFNRAAGGYQGMCAYDGTIYHVWGGSATNYTIAMTPEQPLMYMSNIEADTFIYGIVEAEGIDFTANGGSVLWAKARVFGKNDYAILGGININAKTQFQSTYNSRILQIGQNSYVNGALGHNYNIRQFGSNSLPFTTFTEAVALYVLMNCARIYLAGNTEVDSTLTIEHALNMDMNNKLLDFKSNSITLFGDCNMYNGTIRKAADWPIINYGNLTMNNVGFDLTGANNNRVVHNYALCMLRSCARVNDPGGLTGVNIGCAYVGLLIKYQSDTITQSDVGAIIS